MSKALIVVDMQKDFCDGGALGIDGGYKLADEIAFYLSIASPNLTIVATTDWHIDPGEHFADHPDYADTWPPHCIAGTAGAELAPIIADYPFDAVFSKGQYDAAYSGFEGKTARGVSLEEFLRDRDVKEVYVVGLAFDYCVAATARDAAKAGFHTTIFSNLTLPVHPGERDVRDMEEALRADGVFIL